MSDPWARNDNEHDIDQETLRCRVCGIALLDVGRLVPGTRRGTRPAGNDRPARQGVPDLEVPLVDRAPDRTVPAGETPGALPGTVTQGTPETARYGWPGAGGDAPCRIRCLAYSPARTTPWARDPFAGMWLRSADPHANGGRGYSAWCRDLDLSAVFGDWQTAWNCWRAISWRTVGGQPHRPLTAYAVELVAAG